MRENGQEGGGDGHGQELIALCPEGMGGEEAKERSEVDTELATDDTTYPPGGTTSPCPSSSLSSPEEEQSRTKSNEASHLCRQASQNLARGASDKLITLHALDSTTSNDSADSTRTAIHRISHPNCGDDRQSHIGILGRTDDCVEEEEEQRTIMGGGEEEELRNSEEERMLVRRRNNGGGTRKEEDNEDEEEEEEEDGRREGEDEEEQQLAKAMMRVGRRREGTTKGHHHYPIMPSPGGSRHSRDQPGPIDYASESELDLVRRRQPQATLPGMPSMDAHKLMMALDLRGTSENRGQVAPGSTRRSRFGESYEDSSSLSSDISEPFDDEISTDDLTGSSSDYFGQFSPDKMRQFCPVATVSQQPQQQQKPQNIMDYASFQQKQQQKSLVNAAESAGQLLQKCQSAQRGCAYFGQQPSGAVAVDPHRPSTSNGYASSSAHQQFVRNSDGRRSGCGQYRRVVEQAPGQQQYHPNEQLFALQQQTPHFGQQFRPYHTITEWPPSSASASYAQHQQQHQQYHHRRQAGGRRVPIEPRRVLSPPHNLMVLSDDGDTLSVAAGDIGTVQAGAENGAAMLGQMAQQHSYQAGSLPHRQQHPAYHTHSLDRHAHLRVLSSAFGIVPPSPQQHFANLSATAAASRNLPPATHQRLQLSSLLVSPRHIANGNGYTTGTFAPGPNAALVHHRRSRGDCADLLSPYPPPLAPPPPQYRLPPPAAPRSCASGAHQRSASLSTMSRSMVTVLEEGQEIAERGDQRQQRGRDSQRRVLDYVRRQLAALNGGGGDHYDDIQRAATMGPGPLPPPRVSNYSPHMNRRAPLSLPNNGALSARGSGDSRIYSNLKLAGSGVNSPSRGSGLHQPGSQLSLASSIGSTYSTIEERYEWEIGKLHSELESYRTHVQLLNQKNSGYNCMIQLFDNRLQAIMQTLGKLQNKQNVKRDEVERLCNEIEQLRALSITAGVVPNGNRPANSNGAGGEKGRTAKGGEGGEQNGTAEAGSGGGKKGWIRSSFSRAFHKGHKKNSAKQLQHSSPPQAPADQANNDCSASSSITSKSATSGEPVLPPAQMALLKRELEDRELALTDVQLDALDKAKEIDILRSTVSRLQHENKLLKYNFSLLERRVRSESRASSHISLNTNCCLGSGGGSGMESFDVGATLEEAEAPDQLAPLYDLVASSPSSGDISVNTTTTGSNNSANGAAGHSAGVAAAAKSLNNRNSIASSTGSSKCSSKGSGTAPPSAKVVLCVDLSGRLDSPLAVPLAGHGLGHLHSLLPASGSLCSISRSSARCGSSSTLSSQASSSGMGSVLSGGAASVGADGKSSGRRELTIGHLPLPLGAGTSWRDLDQQLGLLLEEYLHRIDPELSLGVDSYSSIIGYQIHPTQQQSEPNGPSEIFLIRRRGSISESAGGDEDSELGELTPRLTPVEALQPGTLIRMRLKGVAQHSLDSLVLESLFPRHLLEQLLRQLEQHRRLLLFGPTGIGKSNLARLLAKYLLMMMGTDGGGTGGNNRFVDIRFPAGEDQQDEEGKHKVQQAKDQLLACLRPASGTIMLVLDNLQWKRLGLVLEAFNQSANPGDPASSLTPFVICTLNRTCVDQSPVQQLQLHHNFRLYALSYKMDAVNGYLGRYLRRRLAEQELSSTSTSSALPSSSVSAPPLECILHFLGRALRALNEFIECAATGGPDVTLGPRILLQCPLEPEQARDWFVQLWNDKLGPYMAKVGSESNSFSSSTKDDSSKKKNGTAMAKDPTDEICALWPWAEGKERLKRICQ